GTANLGVGDLRLRRVVLALRRRDLSLRAANLFLRPDALQRVPVLLRRLELSLRLRVRDLRLVDELPRDGALPEQLLPALEHVLRGIERLPRGVQIGLRFRHRLGTRVCLYCMAMRFGLRV